MFNFLGSKSQPLLGIASALCGPLKAELKPIQLPTGVQGQSETSETDVDAAIADLDAKRTEWANLKCNERARLLRTSLAETVKASESAAQSLVAAKGSYGNGLGEERALLCTIVSALREYAETLEAGGQVKPRKLYQRADGQYVAEVVPQGLEAMFFGGYRGEVWIQPGKEPTRGKLYADLAAGKAFDGQIGLVLGAGNQISVVILDILHILIANNAVVICKFNPILDFMAPFVKASLKPFIDSGYLRLVYGGAHIGKLVCSHPKVELIHLTGSSQTFDAIVWGGKPKDGEPPLKKEVTAELGCVTPYIVVPGQWSDEALNYYASECVGGLINSAGHNCTKLEVLVTCKDWPQRDAFVAAVREILSSLPRRVAWYPGSVQRSAAFKSKFDGVEELGVECQDMAGSQPEGYLPWLFKSGLSPTEADTQTENWCGVLQEVALPSTADPSTFLNEAVDFANDRCWGSLSCTVLSPPETDAESLDKAVAGLRYGSVCVNAPSFVGYSFPKLSWGAFPGSTPQDVGSGIGCVHNTLLFDHAQKSVLYSPWIHHPTHLWSPQVRNLDATTYRALRFIANPGLLGLGGTALSALRG